MKRTIKRNQKKLSDDEKLQLWSDRVLVSLMVILFLLAVMGFVWFQYNRV